MVVSTHQIEFDTRGEVEIVNITEMVRAEVKKSGIKNGIVLVFAVGATPAITTIEYEPGLLKDLPAALERLFPRNIEYKHHETWISPTISVHSSRKGTP